MAQNIKSKIRGRMKVGKTPRITLYLNFIILVIENLYFISHCTITEYLFIFIYRCHFAS